MAFDPILGAGWLPPTAQFIGSADATIAGQELRIAISNETKSISITIPFPMKIQYCLVNCVLSTVTGPGAANPVTTTIAFKLNNEAILSNDFNLSSSVAPLVIYNQPVGTIFEAFQGDILKLECSTASIGNDEQLNFSGSISIYGTAF